MNGFVNQHAAIAKGPFPRARMDKIAAGTIWNGINIMEKNKPMDNPVATELRHGTHKLRWKSGLEIFCHQGR